MRAPSVNDKRVDEQTGERQKFSSRILPAYAQAVAEGHRRAAGLVPAGPVDRRLRAGAQRSARRGRVGAVGQLDQPADRAVAGRPRRVSGAQPQVSPLRLPVHRRDPHEHPPRRGRPVVPARRDRRARGRREGAARGRGRLPREHRLVGRRPARPQDAWPQRAQARDRRRRARRVGRAQRRLPARRRSSVAGSTRRRTSWTPCPSACNRGRRACCTRWPKRRPRPTPGPRESASARSSTPSTPRPPRSSTATGTR